MTKVHVVSRRRSLKSLGFAGAAMVFAGPADAQTPVESRAGGRDQEKPASNVVDVAVGRMTKGHS